LSDNNFGAPKFGGVPGLPVRPQQPRPLTGLSRRFGDLKVRPKLMVLHNTFFLVLACAVYFSVVPLMEERLNAARAREVSLILRTFEALTPEAGGEELRAYDLRTGSAEDFGLPPDAVEALEKRPEKWWRRSAGSEHVYKKVAGTNRIYRLTLPLEFYSGVLETAKIALFTVLGSIYVLAVLVLELAVLPRYVYQPLQLMMNADAASLRGDREGELIGEDYIPGDEIGVIMRSRNESLRELRRHEDELERAAEDLRTKNEMLEAQDRLVSLGLLSASVAHEMNTPLAVLHGSIEKLLETVRDEAARARLERMLRVTNRLRKISESLLGFARQRRRELAPVEIRGIVEEAWQLVGIDEKAQEVEFVNAVKEGHVVTGNGDQLVQVFVNLLRNALAAAPKGGRIEARSARRVVNGQPALSVVVEDNGPGIPEEVLPEIFDAFVSTRLDAKGTGLGLAVAEGIITQHGGTITAANRPGGGARLEVLLPASRNEARLA
jgi:signal transduction histidine kinase